MNFGEPVANQLNVVSVNLGTPSDERDHCTTTSSVERTSK